ncbi:uncharacterized protein LOC117640242 [Thrips palmi]|uniref:Uncharacterized protein LOC117640242 n=1 Tax=Thrips palmi TaxID=161013 RepID=A0A6P8XZB3_THRPL|nr:uncharacterized protein LOC117640242 [Thrips palmi]
MEARLTKKFEAILDKVSNQKLETQDKEHKILALLENLDEPKEKSLEDKILEKLESLSVAAGKPGQSENICGVQEDWDGQDECDWDGQDECDWDGQDECDWDGEDQDDWGDPCQGAWGGQGQGSWGTRAYRGACFACYSLDHKIAQCPIMQNFQNE